MTQKQTIALSVIIGFTMVVVAVIFSTNQSVNTVVEAGDGSDISVLRSGDYIWTYGNINAPVTIVEFSDYECPFCSRLHPTLKRLVDESEGDLKWQFRHFPIPSHKNAEIAANTAECVGRLNGNENFWQYTDNLFSNQQKINQLYLNETAVLMGIDETSLNECVNSKETELQVNNDLKTVRALGGSGTPYSVIVKKDGSVTPVRGALQYESWLSLLNE